MVPASTDDPTLETILYVPRTALTISNLKRKLAEPEDGVYNGLDILTLDSDSDGSSIGQATTNRGKKLKRHARYVHRGRLAGEYGLTLDGAVYILGTLLTVDCRVWRKVAYSH
jgi:hypothetical protein